MASPGHDLAQLTHLFWIFLTHHREYADTCPFVPNMLVIPVIYYSKQVVDMICIHCAPIEKSQN